MSPHIMGPLLIMFGAAGIANEILSDRDRFGRYIAASSYIVAGAIIYAAAVIVKG